MSLIWSGLADAGVLAGLGECLVLGPGVWAGLVMIMIMIIMTIIMILMIPGDGQLPGLPGHSPQAGGRGGGRAESSVQL